MSLKGLLVQAYQPQMGATYTLLRPRGELDLLTVDDLRAQLASAVAQGHGHVVVDLRDVDHVDIVALSAMLAAADLLREDGRELRVAAASPALRRVCSLLGADDVLMPPS